MKPGDLVTFNKVFDLIGFGGYRADIGPGDVGIYVEIDEGGRIGVLVDGQIWHFRERDLEPVRGLEPVV